MASYVDAAVGCYVARAHTIVIRFIMTLSCKSVLSQTDTWKVPNVKDEELQDPPHPHRRMKS
jgi:hypothetical protein